MTKRGAHSCDLVYYIFIKDLYCKALLLSPVDVTAIIYVVACSSFNMVIREDETTVSSTLVIVKSNFVGTFVHVIVSV